MTNRLIISTPSGDSIDFRPIVPADQSFLYRVYASTLDQEMAQVDWSPAEKEAFLKLQFTAQQKYYTEHFKHATFQLVLLDGEPIGQLYLERCRDKIRIINLALLPVYRNRGIGSTLLKDILTDAEQAGLPIKIHVKQDNPALRLYNRLGFRQIGNEGIYYLMEWSQESGDRG